MAPIASSNASSDKKVEESNSDNRWEMIAYDNLKVNHPLSRGVTHKLSKSTPGNTQLPSIWMPTIKTLVDGPLHTNLTFVISFKLPSSRTGI